MVTYTSAKKFVFYTRPPAPALNWETFCQWKRTKFDTLQNRNTCKQIRHNGL